MVNHILAQENLKEFAAAFATRLKAGDAVLLTGPLGAGKTTFARTLIRVLMQDEALDVPSPTFPICLTYDTPDLTVWHYDLYRLQNGASLGDLGWDEARRDGIAIVEWPERAAPAELTLPLIKLDVSFCEFETSRHIHVEDIR